MKKHILSLVLAVAMPIGALFGAGVETTGIPAKAVGVVHVDFRAAERSPFVQHLRKNFIPDREGTNAGLRKRLGFDPATDVATLTIGLLPPGKTGEKPQAVFIARGLFSPSKILSAALSNDVKIVTVGKHTFMDIGFVEIGSALGLLTFDPGRDTAPESGKFLLSVIDNRTILFADAAIAEAAAGAFADGSRSYEVPESLLVLSRQTGSEPIVLAHIGREFYSSQETAASKDSISPPVRVQLAIADDGREVSVGIVADFPTALDAQRAKARVQTLLDMQKIAFETSASKSPEAKLLAERLSKLRGAIRFLGLEKQFKAVVHYPTRDALWLVERLSAASATSPAPTAAAPATSPARR